VTHRYAHPVLVVPGRLYRKLAAYDWVYVLFRTLYFIFSSTGLTIRQEKDSGVFIHSLIE